MIKKYPTLLCLLIISSIGLSAQTIIKWDDFQENLVQNGQWLKIETDTNDRYLPLNTVAYLNFDKEANDAIIHFTTPAIEPIRVDLGRTNAGTKFNSLLRTINTALRTPQSAR